MALVARGDETAASDHQAKLENRRFEWGQGRIERGGDGSEPHARRGCRDTTRAERERLVESASEGGMTIAHCRALILATRAG